jgi:hypothetical protein
MLCGRGLGMGTVNNHCNVTADCSIGYHQLTCCGSQAALGIRTQNLPDFMTAETAWVAACPSCGCAAAQPQAQDGKMCMMAMITVSCDNGNCSTHCP